jgi:uncharacterized protein YerC
MIAPPEHGTFKLQQIDIDEFLAETATTQSIAYKYRISDSLVILRLHDLKNARIDAILKSRQNGWKKPNLENHAVAIEMLKRGKSNRQISTRCHVSSTTLTELRKELGLYKSTEQKLIECRAIHELIIELLPTKSTNQISEITGASSQTVNRIRRKVNYKAN